MTPGEEFAEDSFGGAVATSEQLVLALDGFEGPIDLLLTLARNQKVDLTRISILQLADQFLEFVAVARRVRSQRAAASGVMPRRSTICW